MFLLPCFVISCENDKERREITEKRLREQNINFEFFDASDGYVLPKEVFEAENIFHDHPGARGVALSHKRIWKKMIEEDINQALIFEDDVIFHEHFTYFANHLYSMTPQNSVMFLGYCCFQLMENGHRISKPIICEHFPLALHAYIMTKEAAQWFLDNFGEMKENVDLHMRNLYYTKEKERAWKSYVWWNGAYLSPLQKSSRFNVFFNGLCYQDHDMKLSIHRDLNE